MGPGRRLARRLLPARLRVALRGGLRIPTRASTTAQDRVHLRPGSRTGLRRLQLGCGPTNLLDDWWNVDIRAFKGVDEIVDATGRWPWTNLQYVYGEHFLEHLPLDGALRFVREAAGALEPGGVLRLSTPSLEHVWLTHFRADRTAPPERVVADTYRANRAFHGWGHQFLYSRPMLERLLHAAGFRDLTFHDYGESDIADLRGLERHPGWDHVEGWPSVWIVEAVASGATPEMDELTVESETEFVRYVRSGH